MGGYEFMILKLNRPVSSLHEIDASTVLPFDEIPVLQAALSTVVPEINWFDAYQRIVGKITLDDKGDALEFHLFHHFDGTSRVSALSHQGQSCYPMLERVCKALGWTALDLWARRLLGANVIPADSS